MPEDNKDDKRKIKPATLEVLRTTILEIFSDGLYHEAGIRDICLRAKVSPKTVYKYFGNKEMLLLSCLEADYNQLYQQVLSAVNNQSDPLLQAKCFALESAKFYVQRPTIARITFQNIPNVYWLKKRATGLEDYHGLLLSILKRNLAAGNFSQSNNINLLFDIFTGSFNRIMLRWVSHDFSDDIVQQSEELIGIISRIAD
jgi:AcrR family transcriptional regulator